MKKLINKNVIKAMTIGISALMVANSMNLTAFAGTDDVDTQPEGGAGDNTTTTTTPENTQSALSLALTTQLTEIPCTEDLLFQLIRDRTKQKNEAKTESKGAAE